MKIKEKILDSINEETSLTVYGEFMQNISCVLLTLSDILLKMDVAEITVGGDKYGGKKIEQPSLDDYKFVLSGGDFSRGMTLDLQFNQFLRYLFEQEEPDGETFYSWFSHNFIVKKWNEFAELKNRTI